jgi:MHS family alpha-ketoglutarate permease-like MFS transporter
MATKKHRGFYSSFQYVTLIMGQLLALAVLVLLQRCFLTQQQLHNWGWRIPFVIGAILALSAMYLRRSLTETAQYVKEAAPTQNRGTFKALFEHPKAFMIVIGLTLGGTVAFYTFSTYMQKFLVNTSGFSKNEATLISASTLFVFMLIQPLFGWLSDKIGRKPLLIAFGIAGALATIPIMNTLGATHDFWMAFALIMAALLIITMYTSINAIVKAELFPVNVRALGVGFPYAISVSIFGGSAEWVALKFKEAGHAGWFYWYVSGCILVSLVVYVLMDDTKKYSKMED